MLWCSIMNMWCKDMDEDDKETICCDGNCKGCENSEEVN